MSIIIHYGTIIILSTLGMVIFGLLVKIRRRRGPLRNAEQYLQETLQPQQVYEAMAMRIMEDARKHRQQI